ncbi:MAG: hypothetical protein KF746_10095 [Chitinophagaceae bacterium]|nr:hypothetical protein [Chitinophagaceae bacterium]
MTKYSFIQRRKDFFIRGRQLKGMIRITTGLLLVAGGFMSCQKVEYETIENPAYIRIFNSLNDRQVMGGAEESAAYLCLLINPELNASGIPVSAEVVGDFLDKRENYAPPYPVHIGVSTSSNNVEYPGKEVVPVGPVLNGFDLSSWAQIRSGQIHVMFMYRPRNNTAFFDLPEQYKNNIAADTTFNLEAGEVYTMQALMVDFISKQKGVVLRKETFHKQPFSDERVYVNFYNYSAKGFWQAPDEQKKPSPSPSANYEYLFQVGIRDTMDVYVTLHTGEPAYIPVSIAYNYKDHPFWGLSFPVPPGGDSWDRPVPDGDPGYDKKYLTTVRHDHFSGEIMPYVSFPLWLPSDTTGKIYTDQWQRFFFLAPGLDIRNVSYSERGLWPACGSPECITGIAENPRGNFAVMNCLFYDKRILYQLGFGPYNAGVNMPNLVVNTHSGVYNPRSFATVNTVEVINGNVYLMTIQRKYDPPVY